MSSIVDVAHADTADQEALRSILAIVRERTGIDFACYRPSTVYRRVLNRMMSVGASSLQHYRELLDGSEDDEPLKLLERVTIKVSRFYRHVPTFDCLRHEVIPRLVAARAGKPLRIWSIGCGCGEEPYTLAMLLHEAGADGIIEATDIDPLALRAAIIGEYAAPVLVDLPMDLRKRYLEPVGPRYRVKDVLRGHVRFSRHDIVAQDEPPAPAPFDLICCRNLLIYLQRRAQEPIFRKLRAMIDDDTGVLCLGEAEWPPAALSAILSPFPAKSRLFKATSPAQQRSVRS